MDPPLVPDPANRIVILGPCLAGITKLSYPADTGFFVHHGWFSFRIVDGSFVAASWDEVSHEGKRAFMSQATTFELWIDGELQKSTMHAPVAYNPVFDLVGKNKVFVVENHDGLRGTHSFVARWFLDASFFRGQVGERALIIECDMTVEFA